MVTIIGCEIHGRLILQTVTYFLQTETTVDKLNSLIFKIVRKLFEYTANSISNFYPILRSGGIRNSKWLVQVDTYVGTS